MKNWNSLPPYEMPKDLLPQMKTSWMLINTPIEQGVSANSMTASWGGTGIIWNRPVAFVFIRTSRYTHDLIEKSTPFSLTFWDHAKYKKELGLCGSKSGRDLDKAKECGFTTLWEDTIPYQEAAQTVIFCNKIAKMPIRPENMFFENIESFYAPEQGGYHDLYIGEIEKIWVEA